jgi:hypothetical protein
MKAIALQRTALHHYREISEDKLEFLRISYLESRYLINLDLTIDSECLKRELLKFIRDVESGETDLTLKGLEYISTRFYEKSRILKEAYPTEESTLFSKIKRRFSFKKEERVYYQREVAAEELSELFEKAAKRLIKKENRF